ncbi:ABC transporter ATP-binding protein [Candidatus Uabimicrobium amorphum]|uniref:ABC transporter ATP-binding protein n=1 Tax=Uabimicrobium amorphum TaxID=2596890 RepID=A0A5S9IK30_UABAM|nr:ABC transporter ATP-binding protein [Candidatus Uabimicrobium amorphum]BBM83308.1 ABC transporter ATP-binding protein [Candidatus Uabimicrobium amorphum]
MSKPFMHFNNLTMSFTTRKETVTAVCDFDLKVDKGQVVSLVGASGCGKTTVLNAAAGFLLPTTGEVLLEGEKITAIEPRCGMVFQSYALFPWLTVKDNVAFGLKMKGLSRKQRHLEAQKYIELVGLKAFANAYPSELSGGMCQRVAICRALANKTDVLLCDEPFAALDAMTRQVMQQELLSIVQKSQQTVLFITHSIDEALIISDTIVVMSARPGRVKTMIDVKLPRPRDVNVQLTKDYIDLKKSIWDMVEEEVRSSLKLTKRAGMGQD